MTTVDSGPPQDLQAEPLADAHPPAAAVAVEEVPAVPTAPIPPILAPPSIADGVFHPLDPRHRRVQRVTALLLDLFLLAGLGIVLWAAPLWGWVKLLLVGIWVFLAWLSWRWPAIEHHHSAYKVDGLGIEIRRGVVWRRVIHVPLSRIQHTDVSQGPLERANGLGTLVIYTAGTDHAKIELGGLSHATALAIRDHLLSGSGGGDAV